MTKRFGFTLAEVLITLGIIGVVAAMTIPTLISNTNGAQFKTAYKKALSTLNQAVLMNIAMEDTDFSTIGKDTNADGTTEGSLGKMLTSRMQSATEISASYEAEGATTPTLTEGTGTTDSPASTPKLSYSAGACTGEDSDVPPTGATGGECSEEGQYIIETPMDDSADNYVKFSFADGTAFWYFKDAEKCTDEDAIEHKCYGFIDVNGATGPNTVIHCANAASGSCESSEITDLYPVIFHGQTVEPATDSARAVLFGK